MNIDDENSPDSPASFAEIERPPLRKIDKYAKAECPCLSQRYTIALLACLGFIVLFGMRYNLAMAKMQFEYHFNHSTMRGFEAEWSFAMEKAVDSSFFWGYLCSQISGGILAAIFPANKIFGGAIALAAFFNLFLPISFGYPYATIGIRVLQGIVEGAIYPAIFGVWKHWAPPLERSKLITLSVCGSYAGVLIGIPLCSTLTSMISWKASFYFYGAMGIIWFGFWQWLTFEKPRSHPAISKQEFIYIEKSLGGPVAKENTKIPWRNIFCSAPFYAVAVANFCQSWNYYLVLLYKDKFLKHNFSFQIHETGVMGALPILLMTFAIPFGGIMADFIRKKGTMSTTNVRKLFNCLGYGIEALVFLMVAQATTAPSAVLALIVGQFFTGFAMSGYFVNHLEIAPRYASVLIGLSNTLSQIAGLICPIVVDFLTSDMYDKNIWTTVFRTSACIHLFGIIFYSIFASGELQPWAREPRVARNNQTLNNSDE